MFRDFCNKLTLRCVKQWCTILHILLFYSDNEEGAISHDKLRRGMVIKQGETVSFIADNLNEQIKLSSPAQSG